MSNYVGLTGDQLTEDHQCTAISHITEDGHKFPCSQAPDVWVTDDEGKTIGALCAFHRHIETDNKVTVYWSPREDCYVAFPA